jgi:hypothetical protein
VSPFLVSRCGRCYFSSDVSVAPRSASCIAGDGNGSKDAAMGVLDDYMVNPGLSLLEKTRIQAQVLVPVMQALRAELGREKADAIVRQALRDWSKTLFKEIGEGIEGSPRRKFATMNSALSDVTLQEVTFEMHRKDSQALEYDVISCRFAEFFRALGEPERGALLVCQTDVDIAAAAGGDIHFNRDQTLMQGGACCTFRYHFEPR